MVELGRAHGVRTTALLTDMSTPLGRAAGNGLEVSESVECLNGGGPADLAEITLALAAEMLELSGLPAEARGAIEDRSAATVFAAMVRAQGGDPDAPLPEAAERESLPAPGAGYVTKLDARAVGIAAWRLGAGRARKEDPVSPAAGALCLKKPGDEVVEGEPVIELHADDGDRFEGARAALENALEVAPDPPEPRPLILERIRS
jgi:thymidine phosphorylase